MRRAALGFVLGIVARLWIATLRTTSASHPSLCRCADQPWVLALWHGQILPLLAFRRRRRTVAIVSLSGDGDLMASAFRLLDLHAVRGSSSRNARAALIGLVRMLRERWDGAVALDGPRGPRHQARPGVLLAASRSGGVVVPFAAACSRSWKLSSWDHFEIPCPFSRVAVVLGEPVHPDSNSRARPEDSLALALDAACAQAQALLDHCPIPGWPEAAQENA